MFFALFDPMECYDTSKFCRLDVAIVRNTIFTLLMMSAWVLTASLAAENAAAQDSVEVRSAFSTAGVVYRYVDYNHVFHNKVTLDGYYIGAPGQNEFYLGLGYQLQATKSLTITPLFYGVIGKEGMERGVAIGAVVNGSVKALNVSGYVCHFEPLGGSVARYTLLDSLDITWKATPWEVGGSTGFVHSGGNWNPLIGPVIIRNDERGSWKVHLRGGTTFEARITRTLTF